MLTLHADKLHVHSVLKVLVAANLRAFLLPDRRELTDKHHVMRIAHGNRRAMRWRKTHSHRKLAAHLRLAHFHLKFKAMLFTRYQVAILHACAGADSNLAGVPLAHQIGGDAAGAVAGNFRFTAIGIDQARANVGITGRKEPLHTVCTHAIVAVANALAEFVQIGWSIGAIHDQEIVPASGSFGERDIHLVDVRARGGFQVAQVC